jgi:DNA modification methylase
MKPDYEGAGWGLYNADCIEVLAGMPEGLIDCAIFSPPFSDLFVYSDSERDMGNCSSHDEFMDHYRFFAQNLFRAMKPGRVACVHCIDLPTRKWKDGYIGLHDFPGDLIKAHQEAGFVFHARVTIRKSPVVEMTRTKAHGLLYKTLLADSSRSRVGMPDYVLFFRKDGINPDPISHTPEDLPLDDWQELAEPVWMTIDQGRVLNGFMDAKAEGDERHICPLQLDVIDRCLRLYSNPGDLVLDPFNGIGSTGHQALAFGRRYLGIELKPEYARQAAKFLAHAEANAGSLVEDDDAAA